MLGRLRFRHLALLVALDEHRNLRRAAAAIHMAQPSASNVVQELELLFGAPLFDRVPTGMQPTELGNVVLAFARRSLIDLKRLSADLDHRYAGRAESLVIGMTSDVLSDLVAQAMAEIKQRRPKLAIQLIDARSDQVIEALAEGQIDLAIGFHRVDLSQCGVDYQAIGSEALCIVVRRDHPVTREVKPTVHSLEALAWILHPKMNLLSELVARCFLRAGMKFATNTVESSSCTMTMDLLQKSDAITILPERAVTAHLQSGKLARLPIAIGDVSIEFGTLTRRGESTDSAAAEFRDLLRPLGGLSEQASAS
jgi:DNA-binding transcriptional LysR family regulator